MADPPQKSNLHNIAKYKQKNSIKTIALSSADNSIHPTEKTAKKPKTFFLSDRIKRTLLADKFKISNKPNPFSSKNCNTTKNGTNLYTVIRKNLNLSSESEKNRTTQNHTGKSPTFPITNAKISNLLPISTPPKNIKENNISTPKKTLTSPALGLVTIIQKNMPKKPNSSTIHTKRCSHTKKKTTLAAKTSHTVNVNKTFGVKVQNSKFNYTFLILNWRDWFHLGTFYSANPLD